MSAAPHHRSAAAPLRLSRADARRLLERWHFAATDLGGAFDRLGSVQFDPLRPLGCNHDLVLQARVPGYRIDDWQAHAYDDRAVLDGWDKQASLVRTRDWAPRRIFHRWHAPRWRERVLDAHPEAIAAVLAELAAVGPLSSTEFEHQVHVSDWEGSWHGPKLTKHVLRGLWHSGRVATHHRRGGKHVYDLVERVVPDEFLTEPEVSERDSVRWLLELRHRAVGLLRPGASQEVWSLPLRSAERRAVIADLVAEGRLRAVDVDGERYHAHPEALAALERPALEPAGRFLAPLDQFVWDRRALAQLFDFEYIWEVYKPERKRRWGYYVLPVMVGDRFVGRVDGRLDGRVWTVTRWWWEEGVEPDGALLSLLGQAAARFADYLGAHEVRVERAVDAPLRAALEAAVDARATS